MSTRDAGTPAAGEQWGRREAFRLQVTGGAEIVGESYWPVAQSDPDLPVIVLAHGWTLNRTVWGRVIRGIQARIPARVVAYDHRGHGQSSPGTAPVSITQLGDDLAMLLAYVAPAGPVVLGGHSMGGMTIMAHAADHPGEFLGRVQATVLMATAAAQVRRPGLVGKAEMGMMTLAARGPRIPAGRLVTNRHGRHLNFGAQAPRRDVALVRRAIAGTSIREMGQYFQALRQMDVRAAFEALGARPCTIIVGTEDRLTPLPYAQAMHEGIAGSRLIELPGVGHMLGYEATDVVVDALVGAARP